MASQLTLSEVLFGMAALTTDSHADLEGEKNSWETVAFFLGRPKQNRPESQRYCAGVEETAICCKGKRRADCQFDSDRDGNRKDKDM